MSEQQNDKSSDALKKYLVTYSIMGTGEVYVNAKNEDI